LVHQLMVNVQRAQLVNTSPMLASPLAQPAREARFKAPLDSSAVPAVPQGISLI
jgi:hypothetical protein